jgi:hypothetical protein
VLGILRAADRFNREGMLFGVNGDATLGDAWCHWLCRGSPSAV